MNLHVASYLYCVYTDHTAPTCVQLRFAVVQVASSEWTLGLQIHQISSIPSVEVIEKAMQYCCCDISSRDVPCTNSFASLSVEKCTIICQYKLETVHIVLVGAYLIAN